MAWCEVDQAKRLSTPVTTRTKPSTPARASCGGQINTPRREMSPVPSAAVEHVDSPIVTKAARTSLKDLTIPTMLVNNLCQFQQIF